MMATEYHCERYRQMTNVEVWDHARGLERRFKAIDWTNQRGQMLVLAEMRYAMLVLMDRLAALDPSRPGSASTADVDRHRRRDLSCAMVTTGAVLRWPRYWGRHRCDQ